MEPLQLTLIR